MKSKCISCKKELGIGSVVFNCPKCSEKIERCIKCRKLSIKYRCKCGLEGP